MLKDVEITLEKIIYKIMKLKENTSHRMDNIVPIVLRRASSLFTKQKAAHRKTQEIYVFLRHSVVLGSVESAELS